MAETLLRFLETYRGSSCPTLAELTSGATVVVKLRGSGNGAEALASEYLVNRLTHAAGFPVPAPVIIQLPESFPWNYGTDEFHDLVRKSGGPNLGLAVIPGVRSFPPARYEQLSASLISQIVTLDRTFSNWDRADLSGNLLEDRSGQIWFIDHGSCRFLHETDRSLLPPLPANHSFLHHQETFDAAWLETIDDVLVTHAVAELPEAWLSEMAMARDRILAGVRVRLALARGR